MNCDTTNNQPIEKFTPNYCVTRRSVDEVTRNLGISAERLKGKDIVIVGDGIFLELCEYVASCGAKSITVIDPTLGLTSQEWFAYYGNILTGQVSGGSLIYYEISEKMYFVPPKGDPRRAQAERLLVDVSNINRRRRQKAELIALRHEIAVNVIAAHLPEQAELIAGIEGTADLVLDHFAAWYFTREKAELETLYRRMLRSESSVALVYPKDGRSYYSLGKIFKGDNFEG